MYIYIYIYVYIFVCLLWSGPGLYILYVCCMIMLFSKLFCCMSVCVCVVFLFSLGIFKLCMYNRNNTYEHIQQTHKQTKRTHTQTHY